MPLREKSDPLSANRVGLFKLGLENESDLDFAGQEPVKAANSYIRLAARRVAPNRSLLPSKISPGAIGSKFCIPFH